MTTPRMVGSIISIEWLARQIGLPVEEVRQKVEEGLRNEQLENHAQFRH